MERTLITEQRASQVKVIFTINLTTGTVISVAPVCDSDAELSQLDLWIDACVLLSGLIHPAKPIEERVAA